MRVFVTGAGGFLGRAVVDRLVARGDRVVAPGTDQATWRLGRGVEVVAAGLDDAHALPRAMGRAEVVVHLAATAAMAAPAAPRRALLAATVGATDHVLRAARAVGVTRVVVVTGIAVYGDTRGRTADESFPTDRRTGIAAADLLQRAHGLAVAAAADAQPVVLAQPAVLYGADDPSPIGLLLRAAAEGFPPAFALPDFGCTFVHRDDAADGVLRVLDDGRDGRSYVLGGEPATLGRLVRAAATVGGRDEPRILPPIALRAVAPLGPLIGRAAGVPTGLVGLLRALDGRTCYARDDRARRELAYTPRPLHQGLHDTLTARRD